ncbi:MAG: Nucleotidyltransferase domain protein [Planctomycetes bacterium ADurb.Bin126]|nr:MAG: Nucleotidyltransferase domain protein [Planctomycetes bacterium ADurb.Bin126]HOD80004.1 nucleotidyltransferase domain-containing protein [Phycisphaerae bacterium]HQL73093.1 nucleotidyltransferase domain-containing protein [Phycisphaerae bacterium]
MAPQIAIDREAIAAFCRRNHIRRLAFFGSVLREDFRPDSDVDVLVEFEPGHVPGLIRLGGMGEELSRILDGRDVELLTKEDLSIFFRDQVLDQAELQYTK